MVKGGAETMQNPSWGLMDSQAPATSTPSDALQAEITEGFSDLLLFAIVSIVSDP